MSTAELPDVVRDALSVTSERADAKPRAKERTDKRTASTVPAADVATDAVLIEFPIGQLDTRFPNSRVDVHLDEARAQRYRCLLNGLMRSKARLANDMPVRTNADVIRWLLDQPDIAAAINPKPSDQR